MRINCILSAILILFVVSKYSYGTNNYQTIKNCKKTIEEFKNPKTWEVVKEIITIVPCEKSDCPVKKKGFK
jgi:hypothetical protein